ncbi:histidine kinase [Sphingomonas sp. QA11]|uniref:sensor histidine kinase n=1 Tax=Sphingomonas sp. QA11 TaxID=2950605 RepID=UPI00234B3541|nr:sensor histidine kinase [Sphingomonas sp. QA11]WCM28615.1 histidine kinase [Sphingomonas sp. QA11]
MALAGGFPALQAQQIQGYRHKHWDVEEGAPSDIRAITQTRDGFLWLGTSNGLHRFDGLTFEKIEPRAFDRWQSNQITALAAAPDGALWVGYDNGGVGLYRNGRLIDANPAPHPRGSVGAIAVGLDGDVWVAVQSSYGSELRHWRNGHWQVYDRTSWLGDEPVQSVFIASDGTLWIAGYPTVRRLARGANRIERVSAKTGFAASFAQDGHGNVWLLSSRGFQRLTGPGRAELIQAGYQSGGLYGERSLLFEDGLAWIAGNRAGLVRTSVDGAAPRTQETVHVRSRTLFRDREGTIWGGGPDGLLNYIRSPVIAQPLAGSATTGFAVAADKAFYVGTDEGVYRIADGPPRLILKSPEVTALCAGSGSLLVVAGDGTQLRRSGIWSKYPDPGKMFVSGGCAIDPAGTIWASAGGVGIYRLADGKWNREDQWPQVNFMVSDGTERLYASQALRALLLLKPGTSQTVWQGDDITVGFVKLIRRIGDYVYIGGERGLARYDGRRFQTLEYHDHPWLSGVTGLTIGKSDAWVISNAGIARLSARDLAEAFKAPHKPLAHQFVGQGLGVSARSSAYMADDAVLDAQGRPWFLTNRGIFSIDPARIQRNLVAPPVSIRSLGANGARYERSQVTLPAGTSRVQFDYVALSLTDPANNSYRYRLDGVDASWIEAGSKRQASYTGLVPGKYRFHVIAANSDGVWNPTGASMTIVITPFFQQTWWFKAGLGLLFAVLLWAFVRWKIRGAAELNRTRIEDRLAIREHIAQELHDTLLQGFQGLVLRFQSIVERLPKGNATRAELEATLERADDVLQDARDRVRYLRERTEPVALKPMLSKIADEVLDSHLAWSVSEIGRADAVCAPVAEDIDRIVSEALFNALRHSRARKVEIRIINDSASVAISIADDGVGIEEEVRRSGQREGHYGLVGMRERAARLGARLEILDGTPSGTDVRLIIPARIAYR